MGDVNGDGVPDFVVGSPAYRNASNYISGRVTVVSGADCSPIRFVEGTTTTTNFGEFVASIGDVDGDGVTDFAAVANGMYAPLWPVWRVGASVRKGVLRTNWNIDL